MFGNHSQLTHEFPNGRPAKPNGGDQFVNDAMAVIQIATAVVSVIAMGIALFSTPKQPAHVERYGDS